MRTIGGVLKTVISLIWPDVLLSNGELFQGAVLWFLKHVRFQVDPWQYHSLYNVTGWAEDSHAIIR